jgi:hypothetical protein
MAYCLAVIMAVVAVMAEHTRHLAAKEPFRPRPSLENCGGMDVRSRGGTVSNDPRDHDASAGRLQTDDNFSKDLFGRAASSRRR